MLNFAVPTDDDGAAEPDDIPDDAQGAAPSAAPELTQHDVVFSFRMAEGTLLRFYTDDIEFVRKVVDLSQFRELGLPAWDARHDSRAFALTRPFALTAAGNTLAFWRHQRLGIALRPGMDEIALALVADAWSRTFRSGAVTVSATESAVRSREGVLVLADGDGAGATPLPAPDNLPPMQALDETLRAIGERYGERTTDAVARQLEYPRPATAR